MKIRPKSPEQIHAQTIAFVDSMPGIEHRRALSRDIAHVATELTAGRSIHGVEKKFITLTDETVEVNTTPDQYVNFLRNLSPEERADIAFLTEKSQNYTAFKASVEKATKNADENSDNYLGRGIGGRAFSFSQDGQDYAAKVGNNGWGNIPAFRRAKDIDGLSHLHAVDLDKNITVMNLVPGMLANKMSFAEKDTIPPEHLKAAIDKAIEMFNAGLRIDPKPSNFLYSKEKGFGFIDYHVRQDDDYDLLNNQVMSLVAMLRVVTDDDEYSKLKFGTPEYDTLSEKRTAETIKVQSKFLDILETSYPEIITSAAKKLAKDLDKQVTTYGPLMNVYGLPEGPVFEDYRKRVERLGLAGLKPKPVAVSDFVSTHSDPDVL